jgi:hypothetical protein
MTQKWHDTHKFENLFDQCKFDHPSSSSCKIDFASLYSESVSQVYNSREAFMKSADSVIKIVIAQYTLLAGLIAFVFASGENLGEIDVLWGTLVTSFWFLLICFYLRTNFYLFKYYKRKIIAGYDLYMSATMQAVIVYHKWIKSTKYTGVFAYPHSWLESFNQNDVVLEEIDNDHRYGFYYLDERPRTNQSKFLALELVKSESSNIANNNHRLADPNSVGLHFVHLAIRRHTEGSIYQFYMTLLDFFCLKLPIFVLVSVLCLFWCDYYLGGHK